jgi:hypothetical protein
MVSIVNYFQKVHFTVTAFYMNALWNTEEACPLDSKPLVRVLSLSMELFVGMLMVGYCVLAGLYVL